jgi:hypothetical protein
MSGIVGKIIPQVAITEDRKRISAIETAVKVLQEKVLGGNMSTSITPSVAPKVATTKSGTQVVASTAVTAAPESVFQKIMDVLEALEPVVLSGLSPFIKNAATGAILADEAPVAQALFEALKAL